MYWLYYYIYHNFSKNDTVLKSKTAYIAHDIMLMQIIDNKFLTFKQFSIGFILTIDFVKIGN